MMKQTALTYSPTSCTKRVLILHPQAFSIRKSPLAAPAPGEAPYHGRSLDTGEIAITPPLGRVGHT